MVNVLSSCFIVRKIILRKWYVVSSKVAWMILELRDKLRSNCIIYLAAFALIVDLEAIKDDFIQLVQARFYRIVKAYSFKFTIRLIHKL